MIDLLEKILKEQEFEDIFQPITPKESEDRDKKLVVEAIKEGQCKQNADGTWDCEGSVDLQGLNLKVLFVKFGVVKGNFYCFDNSLQTLEGSPKEVGGGFYCYNNKLQTLKGSPKEVDGNFYCNHNKLQTLEGIGKVKGEINVHGNPVSEEELLATIGEV